MDLPADRVDDGQERESRWYRGFFGGAGDPWSALNGSKVLEAPLAGVASMPRVAIPSSGSSKGITPFHMPDGRTRPTREEST